MCRDLDVFTDLTRFHRVSIYVSLMSVDVRLIKLFETRSPMPHARLRALRRLTHARLRAGLLVAPVLPGVTDTAAQVAALMAAGRDAGARFVYPSVLRMYADARQRFLPLVQRHFPGERFRRIARRFDIPETDGDREQPREVPASSGRQLSLW